MLAHTSSNVPLGIGSINAAYFEIEIAKHHGTPTYTDIKQHHHGTITGHPLSPHYPGEQMLKGTRHARLGEPSDIASMVAMLVSDEVAWIQGQSVG